MRTSLAEKLIAADSSAGGVREDGLVRRSFGITVRSVNEADRSVDVVVSTETLDAYGEVVVQDWDLKRYSANPVVLWNHNIGCYWGGEPEDSLPIGYSKDVAVRKGQLEATIVFVDEKANPLAEKVWQGFRQKSLHAVSAGFKPHTIARELENDREYYKLSDNELFEISVCPMGANPDAVTKAKAVAQLESMMRPKTAQPGTTTSDRATTEKDTMKGLLAILGLSATATEDEAIRVATPLTAAAEDLKSERAKSAELADKLKTAEAAVKTAETSTATEKGRADKAEARAKSAEDAVVTAGVDALVGKKIVPAERDEMVELALKQPDLYKRMIDKRADLPTATNTVVVPVEKGGITVLAAPDGEAFEDLVPPTGADDV